MLQSIAEIVAFHRGPGKSFDSLLVRFQTLKHRAARNGAFLMTAEGYSWLLLRAVGVGPDQLSILLAPLQGRLPNNDGELLQLQAYLRRMGHLIEGTHRHLGQGRPARAFFAGDAEQAPETAQPAAAAQPSALDYPFPPSSGPQYTAEVPLPSTAEQDAYATHPVPSGFWSGTDTDT